MAKGSKVKGGEYFRKALYEATSKPDQNFSKNSELCPELWGKKVCFEINLILDKVWVQLGFFFFFFKSWGQTGVNKS